jgi:Flp pilus assembly protein TadG
MLEFAVVLPVYLLLLFGLLDFSRLLFSSISLVNGAREMVRDAAISSSSSAGTNAINDFNNLSSIGGAFHGATSVTLSPGTGTLSCTSLPCTITLTNPTSATTTNLSVASGGSGTGTISATSTGYFSPTALGAPGFGSRPLGTTGDYAILTAYTASGQISGSAQSGTVQICTLPLAPSCAATISSTYASGFVQVDVVYTFNFNPLFQTTLDGIIDVWFMRPTSILTTTARSYLE